MRCPLFIRHGRWGMVTVETIGQIRFEHFLTGKTIKEIVRDLRVSPNTVRKVLRSGATSFESGARDGSHAAHRHARPARLHGALSPSREVMAGGRNISAHESAAKPL